MRPFIDPIAVKRFGLDVVPWGLKGVEGSGEQENRIVHEGSFRLGQIIHKCEPEGTE